MGINFSLEKETELVLIIDDDSFNREILSNIFSPYYEIEQAENGREGLEKIRELGDRISAIFLDVIMPELDGIDLLKIIEKERIPQAIPIFLITAYADNDVLKTAYSLGVMDVINKPVLPFVTLKRVQSIIELFRSRKTLSGIIRGQRHELYERAMKIADLNRGMLEALSAAIEFRNGESGEHVRRIYDITKYLLTNTPLGAGFDEETVDNIALGAVMHDVGKIAIPDSILGKPGRLTAEEFEIMKTHTEQGAKLLENIPQLRDNGAYKYAYDIARHHHERWDGKGYPDGLKGDEITVWAQIVSLADVYDALINKRCYKDAYTPDEAMEMIKNGECGVFNPKMLEYFIKAEPEIRKLYNIDN